VPPQGDEELYAELTEQVLEQFGEIDAQLELHRERQQRDPRNFGFAGDLASVRARLSDALTAIGGGEEYACGSPAPRCRMRTAFRHRPGALARGLSSPISHSEVISATPTDPS
jgi:hypothetical protein